MQQQINNNLEYVKQKLYEKESWGNVVFIISSPLMFRGKFNQPITAKELISLSSSIGVPVSEPNNRFVLVLGSIKNSRMIHLGIKISQYY